ncbi:MAG: RNA polymerase sigma factor [Deltaproteobacteria bacterium]|nr:RNA polymerase sigma factor [Deltaproteobacteria bacterium]MBW2253129.1 RNA polymerase sigma factor [Deltaproteobacteria bacterium]
MNATATVEDRFARFREALVGFLRRRTSPQAAEELAQEVWVRVLRAAPDCEDDAAFRAFMYTVARRLLIDHHRRFARRPAVVSLDDASVQVARNPWNPEHQVRADQVLAAVNVELDAMKPELAEVFRWRMTLDVSFKEIADRQRVSLSTALGRMHQATRRIAVALRRAGLADIERSEP